MADENERSFDEEFDSGGVGAASPAPSPDPTDYANIPYRGIITFSVMLATIMQSLDTTIANVALPHMQGTLSATREEMGWVLTSYIVSAAITIPLTGWMANQFGRRKVFLISIVLFTCASALCGLAVTLPQIVLFRFMQGIGGAALVPLSQAVLFDINPPEHYGRAMSIWGMGVTVGPILGPALGGWLTQHYTWRYVFYINLPIGVLAFFGLMLTMPESRHDQKRKFDFFGFTALSLAIAAFQFLLDRGQLKDWFSSPEIITEAAVAGLGLYLFIIHMFSSSDPFIRPELFKDRNFVASNVFIFLIGVVLFATLALLPPMLQDQLQYPVVLTGLVTAPRGIGTLISMFLVGRLIGRIDVRLIMAFGLSVTAYSLWQMTQFSILMGPWPVVWSGITQGVGVGFVYVPLSTVAFTTLPGYLRNEGTSFFNLLRNVGSSIGISVVMFLLTRNTDRVHAALVQHITPYTNPNDPAVLGAHVDLSSTGGLVALNHLITNQATMIGYLDDFRLMMVMTLATIPFLFLIRRTDVALSEHPAVLE
ncbi:MAG: DHA2 family efflux MFS transporter permease subunit [Alphaproteobacteria bacterium]|nr:DHA2 family efflux MFS transporter permease subunit [Alphaproteobacteria bacterium]